MRDKDILEAGYLWIAYIDELLQTDKIKFL